MRAGACVVIAASAAAGVVTAIALRPALAGAQTLPLTTASLPVTTTSTTATTTEPAPDPSPQPDPTPDPGPTPSPTPTPTSTTTSGESPTSGEATQHRTRTPAKDHHRRHDHKRHTPAPAPRFERTHEPRDVPVYIEALAPASVGLLPAPSSSEGSTHYIRTLLFAAFGMALLLLALAAMPTRALAGVSDELLARRSQVALIGISIMTGVAVGASIVLLGS